MCRAAGYHEHALFVAQAAGESAVYLDVLLSDCAAYDEALTYLQGLPRADAAAALKKYGKVHLAPALFLRHGNGGDPDYALLLIIPYFSCVVYRFVACCSPVPQATILAILF